MAARTGSGGIDAGVEDIGSIDLAGRQCLQDGADIEAEDGHGIVGLADDLVGDQLDQVEFGLFVGDAAIREFAQGGANGTFDQSWMRLHWPIIPVLVFDSGVMQRPESNKESMCGGKSMRHLTQLSHALRATNFETGFVNIALGFEDAFFHQGPDARKQQCVAALTDSTAADVV